MVTSPIVAVGITLWYQGYKEKRDEKIKLYKTLIANRGLNPSPKESLDALNSIIIVFSKEKKIISVWNKYFDSLIQKPFDPSANAHIFLDLLAEIGDDLGYGNLKQTDFDRFYSPQSFVDFETARFYAQSELLRVLQNSESFSESKKK